MGWFSVDKTKSTENDPQLLHEKALELLQHNPNVPQKEMEAFELMKTSALQNFAPAQNALAYLYHTGLGTPQNYTEAFRWWKLAADQGHPEAQFNLGVMYANGQGVSQNYTEAIRWCKLAADQGHPDAQFTLGNMYANGQGVSQNYTEAIRWYKLAADQGYPEAQLNLGFMYENGQGVSQNYTEAIRWYKLAADQGHPDAQSNIGFMYAKGQGVSQNYTKAIRWYKLAADQGHPGAQFNLGLMYANGQGVSQNYTEAIRWYKLAADQGHPGAQLNLGLIYANGQGVSQNYTEAFQWWKLAADQGLVDAQFNLGLMYETGQGVSQNYTEAIRWYKLAADQGHPDAQSNIGNLYEHGRGVAKSRTEAIRWFKLAAENGEPYAKAALARLQGSQTDPVEAVHTQQSQVSPQPRVSQQLQSSDKGLDRLLSELNAMTGLANVKSEIYQLVQFVRVQKLRIDHGLNADDISLHSVFTGSPGTGKTTVARLYGQMLKELGFLSKGHLVETDRTGLVAGYVGQTELKTDEKIREALGGILFIDEAYSLFKGDTAVWDFGQEVISVLLKRMEDHRDDLVVIVAGYPEPMQTFLDSNEGLRSRFSNYIHFDDYSPDELLSILQYFCNKSNYQMTQDAVSKASILITRAYESRDQRFGNARYVRNLFESIRKNQSVRIAETLTAPTAPQLQEIAGEDVPRLP